MKVLNDPLILIVLVLCFMSMIHFTESHGWCRHVEYTYDWCRSSRHIWIANGKSVRRGAGVTIFRVPRYQAGIVWYCGGSRERVAWRSAWRKARSDRSLEIQIRVDYRWNGRIVWGFYVCPSFSAIDQCIKGNGNSLNIRVDKLKLLSKPTDNVAFGAEWLFGTPADEIRVNLKSGICKVSSKTREIKQGQTIRYGNSLSINSFRNYGVSFWLTEEDGGFEGKDDLSQKVTISAKQMAAMRHSFDEKLSDFIDLDYAVTVKGKNIFQENKWFGFLAENLCINVLDFAAGPWTGIGRKLLGTAGASKFKKLAPLKSGDIARLYKSLSTYHKNGRLTKKNIFKAVMTYQFRAGIKAAVKKPAQRNMKEQVKKWALDQTSMDEQVKAAVDEAIRSGINWVAGKEGEKIYDEVKTQLDKWGGYIEKLTDSVEFCLSEILPPSRDALYHIYLTVRR